jgi:hypothetical protein
MSGWTAVTVHPPKGLSESAENKANNAIEQYLSEEYGSDSIPTADGYADRTIQVERGADHRKWGERLFEEIPEAKYVVAVSANDTSDSGYGTVLKREDGNTVIIDEKDGYEGAKGNDVVGYIRDEHNLHGYSSWEA